MMMPVDAFKKLDVAITIQYNNRKLLYGLLKMFEMPEEKINRFNRFILILDNMDNIDILMLVDELIELGLSNKSMQEVIQFLNAQPTLEYFTPFI